MMDLNWYNTLAKPALTPPSGIFSPVWTVLYILIFVSVLLYINANPFRCKTNGCMFFIIQLVLNLCWSPVFFMMHKLKLSFVIICLLIFFLILTMIEFSKVSKLAVLLLVPYLLWVCFAAYLNFGFMILN